MTLSANITKIEVPHDFKSSEDIVVNYNVLNLGNGPTLFLRHNVHNLNEFINKMENKEFKAGNYYIKNNLPILLDKTFSITKLEEGEYPTSESINFDLGVASTRMTVVEILTELAKSKSKLKFIEEYYNDKTGGSSFENFKPDFESAEMNASNLIISAKKFNIVLTATIKGEVNIENGTAEIYRYHPFKLVKFGKLVHEYLFVEVDKYNIDFLNSLGNTGGSELDESDYGGTFSINLTSYPIFEEHNLDFSINNFLILIRAIRTIKVKSKSYNFYLKQLRKYMDSTSLLATKREWFHGEEVDDDYISDEGTDYLDVWEKGKKSTISVDKLLTELGEYGKNTRELTDSISKLVKADDEKLQDIVKASVGYVVNLLKDGTIKSDEAMMLAVLSESLGIQGTQEERAKELIRRIKVESVTLNILELKLLTLRHNLYTSLTETDITRNNHIYKLGGLTKQGVDFIELESPQGTLVIKKGEVTNTGYKYTNSFEDINSMISDNIEGV